MKRMEFLAATVTYGDRWALLRRVLVNLLEKDIKQIIVVDNGSTYDVSESILNEFGTSSGFIEVIKSEKNIGSAGGFSIAISAASEHIFDYMIILDDDNLLSCSRNEIEAELNAVTEKFGDEAIVGLSLARSGRNPKFLTRGRADCERFLEFHLLDIPYKFAKRLKVLKSRSSNEDPKLRAAPYGGLVLPKRAFDFKIFPKSEMILYADDYVFTAELVKAGVIIVYSESTTVEDIDTSWNMGSQQPALLTWLNSGSDFRVFYGVRNHRYYESGAKPLTFLASANKAVYLAALFILALHLKKIQRFRLICEATKNGENGILGAKKEFELN